MLAQYQLGMARGTRGLLNDDRVFQADPVACPTEHLEAVDQLWSVFGHDVAVTVKWAIDQRRKTSTDHAPDEVASRKDTLGLDSLGEAGDESKRELRMQRHGQDAGGCAGKEE